MEIKWNIWAVHILEKSYTWILKCNACKPEKFQGIWSADQRWFQGRYKCGSSSNRSYIMGTTFSIKSKNPRNAKKIAYELHRPAQSWRLTV